jgi:hypothetical protein
VTLSSRDSERINHYLLFEMAEGEREEFEGKILADHDLFYHVVELENEMVDRFVRGQMKGTELERFQKALAMNPARRIKIANATAFRDLLADERPPATRSADLPWHRRLGIVSPLPAFVTAIALLILLGITGALVYRNQQLSAEIAQLRSSDSVQRQLEELQRREGELTTELQGEKALSEDLTIELENERSGRVELESELARLQRELSNSRPVPTPHTPTIATLVLRSGGLRGSPSLVQNVTLPPSIKRLAVVAVLPGKVGDSEPLSVMLNEATTVKGLRSRSGNAGERTVAFSLNAADVTKDANALTVVGAAGNKLAEYRFKVDR